MPSTGLRLEMVQKTGLSVGWRTLHFGTSLCVRTW